MNSQILLSICLLAPAQLSEPTGVISGIVLNGSVGRTPLANCQVVLRASQESTFVPIAETTTDSNGRFSFSGLATDGEVIYLPGANRQDVHYPGNRIRLGLRHTAAQVQLIAFDAVDEPSPLVIRRHEIEIRLVKPFLEIAETLVVNNPTLTAYVGQSNDERAPVTLQLSLPEKLEKITFEREFHGRSFQLLDQTLTTDIPWRPGEQTLKFMYRLPADQNHKLFVRQLDRPTQHVVVRVVAPEVADVVCNLPRSIGHPEGEATFEQGKRGEFLPAGYAIEVQLGSLPVEFAVYARWTAVLLLCGLMFGTIIVVRRGRQRARGHDDANDVVHENKRRGKRRSQRLASRVRLNSSSQQPTR